MRWRLHAYTGLQRAGGSSVGARYRDFLRLERLAPEAYSRECNSRLERLLESAQRDIPFYQARVAGSQPALGDFPVLTRKDLTAHFTSLMSPTVRAEHTSRARRAGYGWTAVQTGGTTGIPTTVVHDALFRDQGRASRLYSQYLSGFPFGTPFAQIWGSMRDINHARDSFPKRVLNWLSGHVVLNAFRLDDATIDSYLKLLARRRLRHVMAYVDAAHLLAARALERGHTSVRLRSLMACAGTLTDEARKAITDAFGARVHNKYGSRECTDMACECEMGALHVYGHHVKLEVVDEHGNPLPAGQAGRILVTLIGNESFPLIRYEIGDIGSLASGDCACGRPLPLFGAIEGRTMERIAASDGSHVSPIYFRHLIGVVHNPGRLWRRFQFTQLGDADYQLLLDPSTDASSVAIDRAITLIRRDLHTVLGADASLNIQVTRQLPSEPSGKFLDVRNRARKRAATSQV